MHRSVATLTLALSLVGSGQFLGCGSPTVAPTEPKPVAEVKPEVSLTRVPGSRVSVQLPPGYERIAHTTTFEHSASSTEVTIVDMDGGEEAVEEITAIMMAKAGLADQETVKQDGHDARIIQGEKARAIVIVAGDAVGAVLVDYSEPRRAMDAQHIIASVRFDPAAKHDPLALLGIDLQPPDGMELYERMGLLVIYREPGEGEPPPGAAKFGVGYVNAQSEPSDEELGALVGGAISKFDPDQDKMKIETLTLDDLPGVEMTTTGKREEVPISIFAVALRANTGAFLMLGTVAHKREADGFAKFRALAKSFRRTEKGLGSLR